MKQNNTPSPNGHHGRGSNGRFLPGNTLSTGNPHGGQAAKIRAAMLAVVTPEEAKAIATKLLSKAKAGDLLAIRELLDRTIGKAVAGDVLERIERIEKLLVEAGHAMAD